MSDPFSVTGTAVGIVSLGIQTFQILYKYCSDFKSFPRDVEAVRKQIRGLLGILEGLYEVKGRLEIDNHLQSSQLNMALKECEETLHELKRMAEKRNPTSPPEGVQAKVRVLKERALWSYKKEDLKEVQSSLTRFQNNLSLALQCAGLDGALRRFEDVRSELGIQRQQATKIEQTLDQSTKALEMIHRDVASQSPALSAIYSEIVDLRMQLLESSRPGINSYSSIESTSSSCELIHEPSGMDITLTQREELQGSYGFTSQQQSIRNCSCRCRPRRKRGLDSRRWYEVVTEETYDHRKDCLRSRHGASTKSVAVQLSMYNRLLGFCVQIGWQHSRSGGWSWNAPSTVLRYRAVVPYDSPVFDLLDRKTQELQWMTYWEPDAAKVSAVLSSTALQLRQMFRKTASPTDLDRRGNGILHHVLGLIREALCIDGTDSATSELLDACFHAGVPFDELDAEGDYPIVGWQHEIKTICLANATQRQNHRLTMLHLTQKVESWPVGLFKQFPRFLSAHPSLGSGENIILDCISDFLRLESCSDGLHEDDPLREAMLRRSEHDFVALVTAGGSDPWTLLDNREYSLLLLSWPQALNIVLSHISEQTPQEVLENLLNQAVSYSSPTTIEILLSLGVTATFETWQRVTGRLYEDQELGMLEQLEENTEILRWIKISDIIASHLHQSHNSVLCETTTPGSEHTDAVPAVSLIYHETGLANLSVESAWRTGHRELNTVGPVLDCPGYPYATPFWVYATRFGNVLERYENEKLAIWLMRHGADPFWMHPTCLTTPAHMLARKNFAYSTRIDEFREDVSAILSSDVKDSCNCRCSQSGCRIVGCAVTKPIMWVDNGIELQPKRKCRPSKALEGVFKLVGSDENQRWMASDILRAMTFDELLLTHTCCYPLYEPWLKKFTPPSPEEVKEVQDLERGDIDLLDQIVAELDEKWAQYNKSFLAFMNRVWRSRMRKMHEDRKVDKASYQAELVRLGIALENPDQETDSDAESYGSWSEESEDADSEGWYTTDEEADKA